MRRRVAASFLLCLLVLSWPALAAGQDAERPQKELWDEFTLEPSATPSPAARLASTPAGGVTMPNESEERMTSGALIWLMVVAAGIGAVAARVTARRLPRATRRRKVAATSHPPAVAASTPTTTLEPPSIPSPLRTGTSQPPYTPLPVASASNPVAPDPPPTARPTSAPKPAAPLPDRPFGRKDEPPPAPAPTAKTKPEPAPPLRTQAPRRAAAGRFAPNKTAQPPHPPLTCAIKLGRRPPMGRFVAVAAGGQVLARSPVFKLKRTDDDAGPTPPEALHTLVEELTAAGWRNTAAGRTPWDLRFEREPQGTVTRPASPPRA